MGNLFCIFYRLESTSCSRRRDTKATSKTRMSRLRNKSRGVYKVAPPARMHKIFARATFRTLVESSSRRFMRHVSQIAEDAVVALCYQRVSSLVPRRDETFSPRAICRRQCALSRDSPAGLRARCVSSLIILFS